MQSALQQQSRQTNGTVRRKPSRVLWQPGLEPERTCPWIETRRFPGQSIPPENGKVVARAYLGGLHHCYSRAA